MFTDITLNPKSVAAFVAREVRTATDTVAASDYAIELVTDLQSAIDWVCESGRIDELTDDNTVEFKFRSDCNPWVGCFWVTVYDDSPGCPTELNLSVTRPDPDDTSDYPADLAYESFELVSVHAYSRSDVQEIKRESGNKAVTAYVEGYASGKANAELNATA